MFVNKRFKTNPVLDSDLNPVPNDLKQILSLVSNSFFTARLRNLEIMNTNEQSLYGFLTHYHGGNFCWIQPTRTLNKTPEFEYDRYIREINYKARLNRLEPLLNIEVGSNCIVLYEGDGHWYRAMVVGPPEDDKWLILFVDYGNLQRTRADSIMATLPNHFDAPLQAVCCRLYNIVPRHPDYRAEIDGCLENFYVKHADDFLELKVKDIRPDYVVDCDVFYPKRASLGLDRLYKKHMGQEVVNLNLATYSDPKAAHAIALNYETTVLNIDEGDDLKSNIKQDVKVEAMSY